MNTNDKNIIRTITKESNTELRLKKIFKYFDFLLGEDYSSLFLSADTDIVISLKQFTSHFDDADEDEIIFSLIRSSLLSPEHSNYFNILVRKSIDSGEIDTLIELIKDNLSVRKSLTRILIRNSRSSNWDLLKRAYDGTLERLLAVYRYRSELNIKKKMSCN